MTGSSISEGEEKNKSERWFFDPFFWAFVIVALAIIAAWLYFPWASPHIFSDDEAALKSPALRGDSYGSLNTLFSGLAFGALIVTLLMQRRELEYQRKQMEEQLEEMRRQRLEMENNRSILEKQVSMQLLSAELSSIAEISRQHTENAVQFREASIAQALTTHPRGMKPPDHDALRIVVHAASDLYRKSKTSSIAAKKFREILEGRILEEFGHGGWNLEDELKRSNWDAELWALLKRTYRD